jgi:hypothetical protein
LLAEFASVVDGVQAGVAIQRELKALNAKLKADRRMAFRIGINLGDIIEEKDRIYGDGVNIAARLESLAEPGGLCISRTAFDQIEDKLPLGYEYLGEQIVKNMPRPIQAYKVIFEPEKFTEKLVGQISKRMREHKQPEEIVTGLPQSKKSKAGGSDKKRFRKHLMIYAGVIVFFTIINLFTWRGIVWFHWPALIWGLLQWIVWIIFSAGRSRRKS